MQVGLEILYIPLYIMQYKTCFCNVYIRSCKNTLALNHRVYCGNHLYFSLLISFYTNVLGFSTTLWQILVRFMRKLKRKKVPEKNGCYANGLKFPPCEFLVPRHKNDMALLGWLGKIHRLHAVQEKMCLAIFPENENDFL